MAELHFHETLDPLPDVTYAARHYRRNYDGSIECWHIGCKFENEYDNDTDITITHELIENIVPGVLQPISNANKEDGNLKDYICAPYYLRYVEGHETIHAASVYEVILLDDYNKTAEKIRTIT